MPTFAWWEVPHELWLPLQILAHGFDRGRNVHPSAIERWIHYFWGYLPANDHRHSWLVHAPEQGRGFCHVRCGRQRFDGLMEQSALYLRQQHQRGALDWHPRIAGRGADAF